MNETLAPFSFGGIQSEPDYRDIPMSAVLGAPKDLPRVYRVDDSLLPIWNQRKIGACIGHAAGKKKQRQELKETSRVLQLNPRFVYALAKSMDGLPVEGTYYRYGMKILQKHGIPEESEAYGNDTTLTHSEYIDLSKITPEVYEAAKKYKIASYAQVGGTFAIGAEELMQGIVEGDGVLLGLQIGKEWWTDIQGLASWAALDVLPIRAPKATVGGHAVFCDGYEVIGDSKLKVDIMNSWTDQWADGGRGWFWYDELKPYLIEAWGAIDLPNNYLEAVQDLPSAETFKHQFNDDMEIGQKGLEVAMLQTALMIAGDFDRDLYAQLLKADELGYYGDITRKAVRAFQFRNKVAPESELNAVNGRRTGSKTRAALNTLFAPKL